MKANELRIGNWVNRIKKDFEQCLPTPVVFEEYNWYAIGESLDDLTWYEPIPLTEKWLTDFGFKKNNVTSVCQYEDDNFTIEVSKNNEFSLSPTDLYWIDIKYVHQLQNLYFALTGEELTLNK